jgi:hypothetical protein
MYAELGNAEVEFSHDRGKRMRGEGRTAPPENMKTVIDLEGHRVI